MAKKLILACLASAVIGCAQYAPPPQTYTVVQSNSLFGPPSVLHVSRDGSKALLDLSHPPANPGEKASHVRTLYDLTAHTMTSWSATDPSPQCGTGTFSGDWADPFAGSAEMMADLNKQHPVPAGVEAVNGISSKVFEFAMEGSPAKAKVWIEPKYGLIMKLEIPQADGTPKVALETTQVSFAKPASSLFVASCATAPTGPTEEDRLVELTGGPAADYAFANRGTPGAGGCLVLFRVVRAGSMTPVTSGYEVAVEGKPVPVENGLARIINAPKQFNVDVRVPSGGATAPIFRQCAAPQTTLLLVVKNWDKLGEGADWIWVKSGKFAGH